MHSENKSTQEKSTQEQWRKSYVPVVSAGMGNGNVVNPTSHFATQERRKRQAPRPPNADGPPRTSVLSLNGSSGFKENSTYSSALPTKYSTSSSVITDNRTAVGIPVNQAKRRAPPAPGFPASGPTASQGRSAVEERDTAGGEEMVDSGGEIVLNMKDVEFVPPERPKPLYKASAEPAINVEPRNLAAVEIKSSSTTETENKPIDRHNEIVTEALLESNGEQEDIRRCVESAAETDSLVTEHSQDVVCTANVKSDPKDENESSDLDLCKTSLQESSVTVCNLPSAQSAFQPESDVPVCTKSVSFEQNHRSSDCVEKSFDKEDGHDETSSNSSLPMVLTKEVILAGQSRVNTVENTSPQTEPSSFEISEKHVTQKTKDELEATNQPALDTTWQSSSDGARFRIRSIAKHVSYAEVFGEETVPRAKSCKDDEQLRENNKAKGIVTVAKSTQETESTVRNGGCHKGMEQTLAAEDSVVALGVSDENKDSNYQQINDENTVANLQLRDQGPLEVKFIDYQNIRLEKKEQSADDVECQIIGSKPAVSEGSRLASSRSSNIDRPVSDLAGLDSLLTATDAVGSDVSTREERIVDRSKGTSSSVTSPHWDNSVARSVHVAPTQKHNTCLLYTSPSPRD